MAKITGEMGVLGWEFEGVQGLGGRAGLEAGPSHRDITFPETIVKIRQA